MRALSILLIVASALAGCAISSGSEGVATRDMTFTLDAENDGGGTTIALQILGPDGSMRFTGADSLELTVAGAPVPLTAVEDEDDDVVYQATTDSAEGDLVLDLKRSHGEDVHESAPMPEAFTLATEGPSASEPLRLTWAAGTSKHDASLAIKGDCIDDIQRGLAVDTGAYQLERAELLRKSPDAPATCPLTVTLTRVVVTQVSFASSYPDGLFIATATQRRTGTVDWQP